jgi:hypothetical protein
MTHKVPTFGSRIQVYRGHAKKTSGGLTKSDLMMNKHGRVVSKAKHFTAKKEQRLLKHGYGTQKGKFGFVKLGSKSRKSKSKSRKMRGGMIPLSPSDLGADGISGAGVTNFGSSSDSVQFRAGMSGGRRRRSRMRGGSGMSPLLSQGDANWAGDSISGAGITDFGSSSDSVQFRAGMSGGQSRSLALGRAKARGMGKSRALARSGGMGIAPLGGMKGGTGSRGGVGVGSAALQLEAGNAA